MCSVLSLCFLFLYIYQNMTLNCRLLVCPPTGRSQVRPAVQLRLEAALVLPQLRPAGPLSHKYLTVSSASALLCIALPSATLLVFWSIPHYPTHCEYLLVFQSLSLLFVSSRSSLPVLGAAWSIYDQRFHYYRFNRGLMER